MPINPTQILFRDFQPQQNQSSPISSYLSLRELIKSFLFWIKIMSFFIFLYFSFLLFLFHPASSKQPLCHDSERSALLQFKESFSIKKSISIDPSAYCKTELWNLEEDSDCCSWDGVECNEDTGYVIELDLGSSCLYGFINSTSTIFKLVHLQWLSLADNSFGQSKIPSEIKNLSNLSHLNLSWSIFSGQIPSEILELTKLESLALDRNNGLELQQPGLESLVQKLTNLRVLDLHGVNISSSLPYVLTDLSSLNFLSLAHCELNGTILSSFGNLKNLVHLDLSDNNLWGTIPSSLGNLTNLVYLGLSRNDFWGTMSSLDNLANLAHLEVRDCNLSGQDPASSLSNLTQLTYLDLSQNNFSSPSSLLSWISWISKNTKLTHLDLHNSSIGGEIPLSLLNLNQLSRLDLSYNQLSGHIPSQFSNLTQLEYLDLSRNKLQGTIPSSLYNLANLANMDLSYCNFSSLDLDSSLSNLTQLNPLDLSHNNLSIPSSSLSWIGKNTKLTRLDLSNNNISGEIPLSLMNLNQLLELDLSSNQLSGHIPSQISNLTQLKSLDLSSNNLSGTIELQMFLPLKNLGELDISSTRLSLLSNFSDNTSSHKFQRLILGSCNLRSFPDFLRYQDQLDGLDLSSNNISGLIPGWLFNLSIGYLNLSHNLLTGFDQQPFSINWTLDLSFNKLQGPLPIPSISTFEYYLVSNNNLSGGLSPWICKLNSLVALDLSNNSLSGELPQCLGNFSLGLSMLNLQNNKFNGSIPQTFMNGTVLQMIDLSNNMLRGKIPRSLANCKELEFLDLGNNKVNDTFPSWIGNLPNLVVLNLQSNKLYGAIEEPKTVFEFPKLQVIDLSHNRFTGKLPSKYFECWNAMKVVNASQLAYMLKSNPNGDIYDYSLRMVNKGIEIEYVKISNMLVSICLSNNRFEGEIPASISILQGLRFLNLSNNNLVGDIPSSLDNLTVLESLDLSNNNLSGEIPPQLLKLNPLAAFDVSYNNLSGPIPLGAQFNTFDNRSYEGNPGLCGPPLSRKCGNSEHQKKEDDEVSKSPFAFGWKAVAIGYASGLVIGVVLGHIFCTKKYEWFVKIFGMPLKKIERKRGRCRN